MLLRISTAALLLLSASAPLAAADSETQTASSIAAAVNSDDKMRCRRIAETGSLVKGHKVCKAVGEWRRLSERGNDRAREYLGTGNVCAGGNCGNGG